MKLTEAIVVAIISLVGTLFGSWAGIRQANKLTNYRIEQLEKKVDKHNNLIERTYNLEKEMAVVQEDLKTLKEG